MKRLGVFDTPVDDFPWALIPSPLVGRVRVGKEGIVIDMFGSQGLAPAAELAKAGYKTAYLADGMMDWHIVRDYPVEY